MTLDSDADMIERIGSALASRFGPEVADRAEYERLGGHASMRIYWRVHLPTGERAPEWELLSPMHENTLVAMVLAPEYEPAKSAEGPEEERLDTDELPFVDVQRYLDDLGTPVPAIEHVDREHDVLLLEDLGNRTFGQLCRQIAGDRDLGFAASREELDDLYEQALELLVDTQAALLRSLEAEGPSIEETCICWRRRFDRRTLRWELDHYLDWGLEARLEKGTLDTDDREVLDRAFDALVDELLEFDSIPVLRDFQSSNLMYKEREDREYPWVVIDFQDALVGPFVYDVVSLLRDSYVELPIDAVSELLDHYRRLGHEAGLPWCDAPDRLRRAFHLQTVQRKLKDAGRFVYLDREKNNPDFLEYYEPSLEYVDAALERLSDRDELREVLHRVEPALG